MGKASQRKIQQRTHEPPPKTELPPQYFLTKPLPVFLLLAVLATLIYSNTFSVPFVFDDLRNIVENPRIKDLKNFLDFSGSRYVGFLSFALNYYFGKLSPLGYHLVNLAIHIANGFLVYLFVLLLFRTPRMTDSDLKIQSPWIAFATALFFISHPIQTQAVTYIVQRFASLVTFFYLSAVICYLKWWLTPDGQNRGTGWYVMALLSTIVAMKTKEISFTIPIMIVLIETAFFSAFTKKRWFSLVPFLFTLLIIPLSRIDVAGGAEKGFAQETTAIGRSDYLFTQFRVILTYLRLLLLPMDQNLVYDYPIYHSLFDPSVLLSFLFLSILSGVSFYLTFTSSSGSLRLSGFGMLWFFLSLSIESSLIPIRDVIFEHRLYLPSVGFFLAAVMGAVTGLPHLPSAMKRREAASSLFAILIFSFSLATYQRNGVWKNSLTLWEDVVSKAPGSFMGHNNLGNALSKEGKLDEAIEHFHEALRIEPPLWFAHNSLGATLMKQGKVDEGIKHFYKTIEIKRDYEIAHHNLGIALGMKGEFEEAIPHFLKAIEIKPDDENTHYYLGLAYANLERFDEARREFETALQIDPQFVQARQKLEEMSRMRPK